MKTAVYTCIVGNYDTLPRVCPVQDPSLDFICFTDNPQLQFSARNWSIVPIPRELLGLPLVKRQRVVKVCPHKYLSEYDASLWIDGNISIISSVAAFIGKYDLQKTPYFVKRHPARDCVYREAEKVIQLKKDSPATVRPQVEGYKKEGFPEKFGLFETSVILRRHNQREVAVFDNMWASEIMRGSHRDQLSFDYCRWKTGLEIGKLQIGNLTKDANFRWRPHGS